LIELESLRDDRGSSPSCFANLAVSAPIFTANEIAANRIYTVWPKMLLHTQPSNSSQYDRQAGKPAQSRYQGNLSRIRRLPRIKIPSVECAIKMCLGLWTDQLCQKWGGPKLGGKSLYV
jgi:hypothetical protein